MVKYILLVATTLGLFIFQSSERKTMSTKEVYELMQKDTNIVILDVRTPAEFRSETGHLQGALLIPVQELEERLPELEPYRGKTILAICRSGNRSGRAAALLQSKGFKALNVEGGMLKWNEEKLPVVKEQGGK
jgi:rhodanese-related sulfurtransferase